ncbi:MAG: hypothetical protein DRJ64_00190 [Thermoprotei archaeon]|nr:MAG: hypothetical protein DRJ64_00190 [Thermoprotei archaeon]
MRAYVHDVDTPEYAKIKILRLSVNEGKSVRIDVPIRLLEEAGIDIRKGDEVIVEFRRSLEDLEQWDIVYSCKAYMEKEKKTLISCGGLQISLDTELLLEEIRPGSKIYVYIRKCQEKN